MSSIPEKLKEETVVFLNSMKMTNNITVFDRHRIWVEHDTLSLSKTVNSSGDQDLPLITNRKLAL